jgi:signal transduction histidine kinase
MIMWRRVRDAQPRAWHLAILTGVSLALALVMLRAEEGDHLRHETILETIRDLEALNEVTVEEVLRIRVGDVQNFDRLTAAAQQFGLRLSSLQAAVADAQDGTMLQGAIERYGQVQAERLLLLDDFKSKFAIVRNSLAALPVLLPQLVADLQPSFNRPGLADQVKDLASEVMLHSLTGDEQARRRAASRLPRLAGDASGLPQPQRSGLEMLLAHARLILDHHGVVQQLLDDILAQPVAALNAALREGYSQIHDPVEDQARFYRAIMALIGALFAVYVVFFVARLHRARNDLAAANGELQEARRRAEEAQSQLLEAVEAMDDGFALFEADDRLILCNGAYSAMHPHLNSVIEPGRRFEEIMRTNVYSGMIAEAVGGEEEWIKERMRRWRDNVQSDMVISQGDRWYLHRDRRTPSGKTIAIRADVTSLKEREVELAHAREKAVLADRAKSEFLANMSHEIRTPMNGMIGMSELLARTELNPKQRMFAEVIVKSGNALVTIINDILDFSKLDAGRLELDPQPFALAGAVDDVVALFSTRAEEKGLELAVRMEPGLPETIVGDVGRLRQIVANLVGNAVKFTESGHVLIDVSGKAAEDRLELLVKVADTGIGIAPEKRDSIFEQFSQVDGSSTRRHEGTGLGLAISRRLVQTMGGEIGVESREGGGSVFWFSVTVPVAGEAAPRRGVRSIEPAARVPVAASPARRAAGAG